MCRCHEPRFAPFRDPQTGHVMTKDLSIVGHDALRQLMLRGQNYRLAYAELIKPSVKGREPTLEECLVYMFHCACQRFAERQEAIHSTSMLDFALWEDHVLSSVSSFVEGLTEEQQRSFMAEASMDGEWKRKLLYHIRDLRRQFVIQVADKETSRYTFTCKRLWLERARAELAKPTYLYVGTGATPPIADTPQAPTTLKHQTRQANAVVLQPQQQVLDWNHVRKDELRS